MAERHYLPKSCCLVFSVRTGATILAIMGIIGSGMNLASDSYGLAVIAPQIENYIDEYRIRSYEEFAGIQIYLIYFAQLLILVNTENTIISVKCCILSCYNFMPQYDLLFIKKNNLSSLFSS